MSFFVTSLTFNYMLFFSKKKTPEKLWFSTDIHCHIVPGVDDGSPDAATSADLIERMQAWGIERIIASPHVTQITFENTPETIAPAMEALHEELSRRGNNIPISNSAEYRIDEIFYDRYAKGELTPYPNNYVLVENGFIQEPYNIDNLLFDMQVRGFQPMLAHPERYFYYHDRKARYKDIHTHGTKLQINLLSLAGYYGKQEKRIAEYLIENELVDFIGTDLHNADHADAIDRYLSSSDYRRHRKALDGVIQNDIAFNE